jgi:hypothetical protein
MRTLTFSPQDTGVFADMYVAFLMSKRTLQHMGELPTVMRLVEKLAGISEPVDQTTPMRRLQEHGGQLTLEEDEYAYLREAVFPPAAAWNNQGILTLARLHAIVEGRGRDRPLMSTVPGVDA